jgi:hypothetical protein
MLFEIVQRAASDAHDVDVRDVRRKNQQQSGAWIQPIQAGLAQHQAG